MKSAGLLVLCLSAVLSADVTSDGAGGPVVCGLRARLSVRAAKFRLGDRMTFDISIRNLGTSGQALIPIEFVDRTLPSGSETFTRAEAGLTFVSLPPRPPCEVEDLTLTPRAAPARILLHPGEAWMQTVKVEISDAWETGRYRASFTYFSRSRKLVPGSPRDLESNAVQIQVVP